MKMKILSIVQGLIALAIAVLSNSIWLIAGFGVCGLLYIFVALIDLRGRTLAFTQVLFSIMLVLSLNTSDSMFTWLFFD